MQTENEKKLTPGQSVTWIQSLGSRRGLQNNFCAGLSRSVPAKVVSVGPKLVTIEVEGEKCSVKPRNLKAA